MAVVTKGKIRAIITGSTGMVGEGVLQQSLFHPDVEQVLVINRKPCGVSHPKLKEILHGNFLDLAAVEAELKGYNACFFCLGVSFIGLKEEEYHRLTYDLTLHFAKTVSALNPDMVFCYVSGAGTDSTEQGKSMWARVKGKTENHLMKLLFRRAFMFRPGYMHADKGAKNTKKYYPAISWMYPIFRVVIPNFVSTLKDVGNVMIHVVHNGPEKSILEVEDINSMAQIN